MSDLVTRIQNNIVYSCPKYYPKLPKMTPKGKNLPLKIGSKVEVKVYNSFLDHNESCGYKFLWENKNVFIVDMAKPVHEFAVSCLFRCFDVPNGGVIDDPPVENALKTFYYDPSNNEIKIAADMAICPNMAHVQNPLYLGPPPGDLEGNPHARIIVEVASSQNTNSWITKCENWLLQQYVRCVFGIKLHDKKKGTNDRSMTAKLWTRQTPPPPGSKRPTNPALIGVSVLEWDFGTLGFNSKLPTGCVAAGNPAYQVNIPVSVVFWDPPIVAGVPDVTDYDPVVPPLAANNFTIDLFQIQQVVLRKQ